MGSVVIFVLLIAIKGMSTMFSWSSARYDVVCFWYVALWLRLLHSSISFLIYKGLKLLTRILMPAWSGSSIALNLFHRVNTKNSITTAVLVSFGTDSWLLELSRFSEIAVFALHLAYQRRHLERSTWNFVIYCGDEWFPYANWLSNRAQQFMSLHEHCCGVYAFV